MNYTSGFQLWYIELLTEFGQAPDGVHVLTHLEETFGEHQLSVIPKFITLAKRPSHQGDLYRLVVWWPRSQTWEEFEEEYPNDTTLMAQELMPLAWVQAQENSSEMKWYAFDLEQESYLICWQNGEVRDFYHADSDWVQGLIKDLNLDQSSVHHISWETTQEDLTRLLDETQPAPEWNVLSQDHTQSLVLRQRFRWANRLLGTLLVGLLVWCVYLWVGLQSNQNIQVNQDLSSQLQNMRKFQDLMSNEWPHLNQVSWVQSLHEIHQKLGPAQVLQLEVDGDKRISTWKLQFKKWEDYEQLLQNLPQNSTLSQAQVLKRVRGRSIVAHLEVRHP